MNENKQKIIERYYQYSTPYLLKYWSDKESMSIHYGFWYPETKSRSEAFLNQHRSVVELLQPSADDYILDIGCGVGGVSTWLAQHTPARYVGITLADNQIRMARQLAQRRKVADRTAYSRMDFFKTSFNDNTFTKAFAIESICHSYPRQLEVFREMYRILKKGATLLISDSALFRQATGKQELKWVKNFCNGWAMTDYSTINDIVISLKKAQFKNIRIIDRTKLVSRNINQIYWIGIWSYPLLKIKQLLGHLPKIVLGNNLAAVTQKKLVNADLAGYFSIIAHK
ncbi:MAG: SAM-dependent methyltransferase [Candidatus Kerfeldbacteria bacterium]|jgi:cyclopropane fatty-acyl-phospholipid synthase-like methyltransferase